LTVVIDDEDRVGQRIGESLQMGAQIVIDGHRQSPVVIMGI
jgi:hypothetical protein